MSDTEPSSQQHTIKPNPVTKLAAASVGTLSFLASLGIVVMICLRRNGGLNSPYRRIIFGISISDMIQSFAILSGPFLIPSTIEDSLGIGNDTTCNMDGFLLVAGGTAVPLYTFLLSLYYLCKLKFRMTNEVFTRRIEWMSHILIILFVVTLSSAGVGLGIIGTNQNKSYCIYVSRPLGCLLNPETVGECEPGARSRHVRNMYALVICLLPGIIFIFIFVAAGTLYCHAVSWKNIISIEIQDSAPRTSGIEKSQHLQDQDDTSTILEEKMVSSIKDQVLSSQELSSRDSNSSKKNPTSSDDNDNHQNSPSESHDNSTIESPPTPDHPGGSDSEAKQRARSLSQLYTAETKAMFASYILAFAVSYLPLTLFQIVLWSESRSWFSMVLRIFTFFYPLGGLFNILVYTRPQVTSLRRKSQKRRMSRVYALYLVLRAGGEVPDVEEEDASRSAGAAEKPISHVVVDSLADVSDLTDGNAIRPGFQQTSLPNSAGGINGRSLSMGEDEAEYNPKAKRIHNNGGMASLPKESQGLRIIDEGSDEGASSREESGLSYYRPGGESNISNPQGISISNYPTSVYEGRDINSSSTSTQEDMMDEEYTGYDGLSSGSFEKVEDDVVSKKSSDIWASAFKRAREWRPSM